LSRKEALKKVFVTKKTVISIFVRVMSESSSPNTYRETFPNQSNEEELTFLKG